MTDAVTKGASVADVLVPVAVDIAYSYKIPAGLNLAPGDFVTVPLGARETTGVVWDVRAAPGGNLKSIIDRRDLPPLRDPLRRFIDWVANWTLAPRGMVMRMATRAPDSSIIAFTAAPFAPPLMRSRPITASGKTRS